ncbi:hypothetical protein Vadar_002143 [Vaccinium darrowii]|uniref:Uncharacterized protein n=1 Tax=Vaccinium darrowii TaxID=229202 RepID=A0ACB7X736_9ERIC|nr:hypothetical protein Vadar_002143 [Vaccinium darrowii]
MAAEEGWPVVILREGESTSSKWIFWYVMNGDEEGNGRIYSCCHVCVLGKRENYIESKKPVLYVGGGCLNSSEELRRFVEFTGIPIASTLMVLRAYPISDDDMSLGMHGTVYAIYAV